MKINREKLLANFGQPEEKLLAASIIDKGEKALETHQFTLTDFLDPSQLNLAINLLQQMDEITYLFSGGFPGAERKRVIILPSYYLAEVGDEGVAALQVEGNFKYNSVSHRDYLGSILGSGVRREKIGDLLVIDNGCQVVVAEEIKEYLLLHLDKVGKVAVKVKEVDLDELQTKPEKVKEIKTTVASLRLDAVASSGFGVSRSKMVKEIEAERVKVNWKVVTSPSYTVKPEDVISSRGKGRVMIEEIKGETKKGRTGLILKRYI